MSRSKGYKCFNIKCGSCIGKTLCGEPEDTALGCVSRVVGKPMTNADRIRAMNDEELAKLLCCTGWRMIEQKECIEWLQMPAEEDDHSICGSTNLPCIKCNPGGRNNRKEGADNEP